VIRVSGKQARRLGILPRTRKPSAPRDRQTCETRDPIVQTIVAYGWPKPVKEFQFAHGRRWKFDYCWPGRLLALEIEGGIYGRTGKKCMVCGRAAVGAHTSIERLLTDMEKYNAAAAGGYRVVRATPGMVNTPAKIIKLLTPFLK